MKRRLLLLAATLLLPAAATLAAPTTHPAHAAVKRIVDRAIHPLMQRHGIPGMAVGVIVDGRPHVFHYGVASLATRRPVTARTLFEVGSISKTFTVTLAAWAQERGKLTFAEPVQRYLPALRGSTFGRLPLRTLATHTPGGLPLQVPDAVHDRTQLMAWLRAWRPAYPPDTRRTYSNIGIGTLGLAAAHALHAPFVDLMQQRLLPALGLDDTFYDVPAARRADYAQGYTDTGKPIRLAPGVLWHEAYGVKTTAADLLRFVRANMGLMRLPRDLRRAIALTHTGYVTAGPMTQDLIWEQYPWPASLASLRAGNGSHMIFDATPVTPLAPPLPPRLDAWINKTGSTNGFAAYVAFVPGQRMGIVLLANRSLSLQARVDTAYAILTELQDSAGH